LPRRLVLPRFGGQVTGECGMGFLS
jgi:hypothetical protein